MSSQPAARSKRPLSVWVLTLCDTLIAVILLAASFKGSAWGVPVGQVIFWGALGLGISFSASLAWMGSRYARNVLLLLIAVYCGLVLIHSVQAVSWGLEMNNNDYVVTETMRGAFALLWIAANFWLLLGRRARAFFA